MVYPVLLSAHCSLDAGKKCREVESMEQGLNVFYTCKYQGRKKWGMIVHHSCK